MEILKRKIEKLVSLYKSRNLTEAENSCTRLLKDNPRMVFLYNIMGLILADQKRFDEAIQYYEKGTKVNPDFAMIYNNLGTVYRIKGEDLKAENSYKKAILLDNKISEPLNNLGNLYRSTGKYTEAIKSFRNAITIKPDFFWSYYNLGISYISMGDFNNAIKSLEKCIEINKYFCPTHRSLSRLKKYTSQDKHFKQMNDLINDSKIIDNNKIELSFALGKAYEDINDFKKSFKYYKNANDLQKNILNFSIKKENEEFKNIKNTFNKNIINKSKNTNKLGSNIIFIIGMPRSGTTLIEQIISSHAKVYGGGELNFIPNILKNNLRDADLKLSLENINLFNEDKLISIGNEYLEKIKIINKKNKIITDKLPINFKWVGFIKIILPNAKIIHVKRNSKDNCFSIYKNHFPASKIDFAYDLDDITNFYNLYSDLMTFWHKALPNEIIDVVYEELIVDPKKQIKKLLNFCDLKWDENCVKYYNNKRIINTASDIQARQKLYKSSINSWKKFETDLSPFFKKIS